MKKKGRKNPLGNTELVLGGAASLTLIALGIYLVYEATNQGVPSTTDTLSDTSSLAALGIVLV